MDLQQIITEYKKKSGARDADIARITGVSRSTVMRWCNGSIKRVNGDTVNKISKMVGFNVQPVLKGMDTTVKLPVLGYVKGGYDLFAQENYLGEEEASLNDARRGDYFLKVTGDSMDGAGILDGSLVLVKQSEQIDSGKIGVILVGDEVTVKRVVYKNKMMILEAANPTVASRYFDAKEVKELPVKVLGEVIACKTYY